MNNCKFYVIRYADHLRCADHVGPVYLNDADYKEDTFFGLCCLKLNCTAELALLMPHLLPYSCKHIVFKNA